MNNNSPRRKIKIVVGISATLLLILFAFFIDLGDLVRLFGAINWGEVIGVTAVLLVGYILLTVRLRYILQNQAGWWETFYANSIGFMVHIALFVPAMMARGW